MSPEASRLALWRAQPSRMVLDLWGEYLPNGLDWWQIEALDSYPTSPRLAMKACKGPGKTCVLAWIGWNFLLTREDPEVDVTSITGDNLKTNLWTELARWYALSPLLQAEFEITGSEIYRRAAKTTWKLRARTWPRDADATAIGNALAGVHAKYVMWLLDESGDYPNAILPTCEAIFSGEPIEAHIVQAGNPTQLDGPLYRACTVARELWKVIEITGDPDDPRRASRISIKHAREQIAQYGADNPWVLVNIFGRFPPAAFNALIGIDEVTAAMRRVHREDDIRAAARVLSVDVARYGDDSSVIARRQGLQIFNLLKYRNVDSIQGAGIVAREWAEHDAHACFVDATGGHGWGWIDQLKELGRAAIPVQYAGEPHAKERYHNKRCEMAFDFVQWIKHGGGMPDDPRLAAALTQTTYSFKNGKMLLEPKELVKEKLGYSPDEFDACMGTFAEPIVAAKPRAPRARPQGPYQPFAELDGRSEAAYGADSGYTPFRG